MLARGGSCFCYTLSIHWRSISEELEGEDTAVIEDDENAGVGVDVDAVPVIVPKGAIIVFVVAGEGENIDA